MQKNNAMYNQYDDYEPEPRDPSRHYKGNLVVGIVILIIATIVIAISKTLK